jgi:molybdopterin-containing oxidoreductase family iron-sulfur binding subunit
MKLTRKDLLRVSGLGALAMASRKFLRAAAAKQWGMVIDLQKCRKEAGCDACIKACNVAHNIPQIPDSRHEVKWIWNASFESAFPTGQNDYTRQEYAGHPIAVLCNHCADPPCVRVCPTGATWKRQEDGIVMMDYHRCIGCKYCIVACPYGARSFNFSDPRPFIKELNADFPTRSKGVVEKCNFCAERLARRQQPACVTACPEKAMIFGNVADPGSDVRQVLRSRNTIRRKPELGTGPNVFYIL